MWQVKAQMNKANQESSSSELEWSAVLVDTQEEAERWWTCRTGFKSNKGTVHTMWNPQGEVVRVKFN